MILYSPATIRQLGFASAGLTMTPEEFRTHDEWEEGYRYELVHGVLVVNPPPGNEEVDPNEVLGHWLRTYREQHPLGAALDKTLSEREFFISDSVRRADRAIWTGLGRTPDTNLDVPSIVVEFLSPGKAAWRRDYEEKRDEYLGLGVKEYWVFDRFARQLTVYAGTLHNFATRVIAENEIYTTPLLPGFELPLASLLKLVDEWKKP